MTPSLSAVFRSMGAFALISFFICSAVSAKVEIEEQAQGAFKTTRYRFSIDRMDIENMEIDGRNFSRPVLRGVEGYEGILYEIGKPEIPVIRFYVDSEAKITASARTSTEVRSVSATAPLKPSLPSVVKLPGEIRHLVLNRDAYNSDTVTPSQLVDVVPAGSIRGQARYLVTVYPAKYKARSNALTYYENLEVEVQQPRQTTRRAESKRIVLVVPPKFANSQALSKFTMFKLLQGYKMLSLFSGSDTAEQIRNTLRVLYQQPDSIHSVILVGDVEDVPSFPSAPLDTSWPTTKGVTDHNYRSLDTEDYTNDINGPDVGVGRWAVSTEAEIAAIVMKMARYEVTSFDELAWFSFIASDDPNFWQVAEGSFNYGIEKHTVPLKLQGDFPSANQVGGDRLYAITHSASSRDVLERIKKGRGFINYGGHGSVTGWQGPTVSQADVKSLSSDATPVVISNACLTGRFTEDSFAETWLRHPNGAVFFLGSMSYTYWDEDDILQRAMYDKLFANPNVDMHTIIAHGNSEVWRHYGGQGKSAYYWETYVSFGDPSLRVRVPR